MLSKAGDKVYVRNQGKTNTFSLGVNVRLRINIDGKAAASGNIMSLIDKDCTTTEIPSDSCFAALFAFCTGLVSAPSLPATTLTEGCYIWMFYDCPNLKNAPVCCLLPR